MFQPIYHVSVSPTDGDGAKIDKSQELRSISHKRVTLSPVPPENETVNHGGLSLPADRGYSSGIYCDIYRLLHVKSLISFLFTSF